MADLKTAVESGRRWRHKSWRPSLWAIRSVWINSDGTTSKTLVPLDAREAISSDFEIEPEPEKPREWWLNECIIEATPDMILVHASSKTDAWHTVRVHDADACDRLHAEGPCLKRVEGAFLCAGRKGHAGECS